MQIKTNREGDVFNSTYLTVIIGETTYRISETVDGRLTINKTDKTGTDDYIKVHPRSGNEIDVS